jgi:AsmA family
MRVPCILRKTSVPEFPKWTMPDWRVRTFTRPQRITLWIIGGLIGALVLLWAALNLALANPRFATPAINWGLQTFGNKAASIENGKLDHPFGSRFVMTGLAWPGRAEANEIDIAVDLFGWLPSRPWTSFIRVRDGELILDAKTSGKKTIDPQRWVNRIDAQNITLKYTRRGEPREVKIISADGSFARGTVRAEAVSGPSRITFDGMARSGGNTLQGSVTAKGENLKNLAELVGASAPDTPPFNLTGKLQLHARTWSVTDIAGRMGDSDLGGAVAINLANEKPFLNVDLKSNELDFDDLGVVFGIPMGVGAGETANAEQRQAKAAFNRSSRLIPDAHIDFTRLKAVDGDIKFAAEKVVDAPAGIASLAIEGTLRDRVLDFKQVLVKTATGNLDAKININGQKDPAVTRASGKLEHVAIARLVNTPLVRGSLSGVFKLDLTGSGFREAFGAATGEIGLWSNDSEIAKIADEAAGLDVGEVLIQLAKDNPKRQYIKSTCLAGNIAISNGQAQLSPAVIDNADSVILATGGGNLKDETLDIRIFAKPKDISFGKLNGDIKVKGTLRRPSLSALSTKTVVQAAFSSLLSSIAGPLSALPFIETGGGKDAPCAALIADAKAASKPQTDATKAAKVAEAKQVAKEKPKDQVKRLGAKTSSKPNRGRQEANRVAKKTKSLRQ